MRKAGQRVKELLTPWVDQYDLADAGNWQGLSEREWIQHTNSMRDMIAHKLGNYRQMSNRDIQQRFDGLVDYLTKKEGYTTSGAEEAINKLMRGRNPRTGILTELDYGTAHTNADEQLARLTLELSGFANPQFNNRGNVFATDFVADSLGGPLGIDAQSTFRRDQSLSMPVVANVNNARGIFTNNPDANFLESILQARDEAKGRGIRNGGAEMKLLETSNPEFNPSGLASSEFKTLDGPLEKEKHYLMVNHRGGQTSDLMQQVTRKAKGPYDITRPNDMDLIPMQTLREKIFERTPAELAREGVRLDENRMRRSGNHQLSLILPQRFYSGLVDPMGREISSDVRRAVLGK